MWNRKCAVAMRLLPECQSWGSRLPRIITNKGPSPVEKRTCCHREREEESAFQCLCTKACHLYTQLTTHPLGLSDVDELWRHAGVSPPHLPFSFRRMSSGPVDVCWNDETRLDGFYFLLPPPSAHLVNYAARLHLVEGCCSLGTWFFSLVSPLSTGRSWVNTGTGGKGCQSAVHIHPPKATLVCLKNPHDWVIMYVIWAHYKHGELHMHDSFNRGTWVKGKRPSGCINPSYRRSWPFANFSKPQLRSIRLLSPWFFFTA